MKKNPVGWFEIPVVEMDRAIKFYESVFEIKLERHTLGTLDMAWFPMLEDAPGASGSLVRNPDFYRPSANGALVYFTSSSGDVDHQLSRVEAAGGKVLIPKKHIADGFGYMGVFIDTEGNQVAVHCRE